MIRLLSDFRVRVGACAAAMVVAAGVGLLASTPAPSPSALGAEEAGRAVVNRTALSCPAPGAGSEVRTTVNAVAPVLPAGTPTATGKTTPLGIVALSRGADPIGSVPARGRIGSTPQSTKLDPLAVRGTGPLAAGAVATATSTADEGVNRGMASVPCLLPGSDFWFVGASAAPGRRDVLVLTNLDSVNAQVDVSVFSAGGVQDVPSARGIVVPARGTASIYLGTVLPKLRDLALRVVSTGGRVAPAIRDNVTNAAAPGGVDWLNLSTAPARKVVVPALAPGAGLRTLTVVNPGDLQASTRITVNGPNGPFKPAGRETLNVPAGAVKVVRLDPVLHGEPTAVTIESDQPVTASARMSDPSASDFATVGATDPLTGPAYLALPPHTEPVALQVTAPGGAGGVRYELRDAAGKVVRSREQKVPAGATSLVTFEPQAGPTYLTVTPQQADLVAGVTLTPPAKKSSADDDEDSETVVRVAAWPLTTSQVFRAQLGAQPDIRAALR